MSYAQMKTKLQALVAQNPEIATLNDIGDSWEKTQGKAPNNDIWSINITSKKNPGAKPASLFIGGMHARELAPPEIMVKLAETLVSQYGKDPAITELVDTRDINIVPIVNVDGRIQVEKGNNWQRKNTHGQGVDLNRNFDSHWNYQGLDVPSSWVGDSSNPGSETYSGSSAASEPETQAVQNM
jgi:carboxypeptidase T